MFSKLKEVVMRVGGRVGSLAVNNTLYSWVSLNNIAFFERQFSRSARVDSLFDKNTMSELILEYQPHINDEPDDRVEVFGFLESRGFTGLERSLILKYLYYRVTCNIIYLTNAFILKTDDNLRGIVYRYGDSKVQSP